MPLFSYFGLVQPLFDTPDRHLGAAFLLFPHKTVRSHHSVTGLGEDHRDAVIRMVRVDNGIQVWLHKEWDPQKSKMFSLNLFVTSARLAL
jgi:hypothetical protein